MVLNEVWLQQDFGLQGKLFKFLFSVVQKAHNSLYAPSHLFYTAGVDESSSGIGDINFEPFVLGWHKKRYDGVFGIAFYLPTGDYDKNDASSIGKDHYTVMISGGTTIYPDPDKLWSLSILCRYEKHFKNRDTDVTYGDDFSVDWGLGRKIGLFNAGISGYAHWQLTDNSGDDDADKDVKDHIFGIGPEVQIDVPAIKGQVRIKYYKEFEAKDTAEGDAVWLTLVKSF